MDAKRLESLPLFRDLSRKERDQISRWTDEIDVPAGYHLLDQGRLPHEFFVLEKGTVAVTKDGEHLTDLGPGDFFGEIAIVEHDRRTASVVANTPVTAIVMLARDFETMAGVMPHVAEQIRRRDPRTHAALNVRRDRTLAAVAEERPEELAALLFEQAARQRHAMVQALVLQQVAERTREPRLGVARAEHHAVEPGEHDRAGAHRTRLQRDVHGASVQPPRIGDVARLAQRQHLGVRGRILHPLAGVAGGDQHVPVPRDHRAHGDVAGVQACLGFFQREAHHPLIEVGQVV